MAVATHHALVEALNRPLETIPASRQHSPAPRVDLALSSPYLDHVDLPETGHSAESSRCGSSCAPSFHSAKSQGEPRRPRPTPLAIPHDDESQPLFSSYPLCGPGREKTSDQQPRPVTARHTSSPSLGRQSVHPPTSSTTLRSPVRETSAGCRMANRSEPALSVLRRRSLSSLGTIKRAQDRSAEFGKPDSPTRRGHKRRSSLGSGEFDIARWREMGSAAQFDRNLPYGYGRHELELRRTATASQPAPSPDTHLPLPIDTEAAFVFEKLKIARDEVPPRSSSLPYESGVIIPDNASIVSMSDPSLSSPSMTTKSLPSTKTSLSRSARSGREGEEYDEQQTETSQVLLHKRRMIILEIVETEISYVHALRALVHIYLPQLAVLPQLSDRNHTIIARNATSLLDFHTQLAAGMIDILKCAEVGYEGCQGDKLDRATLQIAELFVRESSSFALYSDYCAGSMPATAVMRDIVDRVDYEVFEKRCQYISSATAQASLRELLTDQTPRPCRVRLRFRDILIAPIQRVCRYPLLLASLLADVHRDSPPTDIVSAVEASLAVMRNVAENADDARRQREAELKTAAVIERLEPHNGLQPQLLRQLGACRLIGALDVLYHHSLHAPLDRPAKVRYLAAFLYRGYLILAKPKRSRFEVRHYLPLEVLEIIDIKEGYLPFSIRLAIREHCFDLATTCEAEKELWTSELSAAREESTISPFELPSSIPLFTPRSRHGSTNSHVDVQQRTPGKRYSRLKYEKSPNKRHSMLALEPSTSSQATIFEGSDVTASPDQSPVEVLNNWDYSHSQPSTIFLQRPSLATRLQVDRSLSDVVSESLATARSKTQLQLSGPDRRSMSLDPRLRRRRSMAEMRPAVDVVAVPEVRGAVITRDRPRSLTHTRSFVIDRDKRSSADISHNSSFSSIAELSTRFGRRYSTSRSTVDMANRASTAEPALSRSRTQHRRAQSSSELDSRARSVPPTPIEELISPAVVTEDDSTEDSSPQHDGQDPTDSSSVEIATYGPSSRKNRSVRRSLSFFSRKSISDAEIDDFGVTPSSNNKSIPSSGGSTTPPQSRTAPTTPDVSPHTPIRRRSMRLLGQLRGFTPI